MILKYIQPIDGYRIVKMYFDLCEAIETQFHCNV